MEQTIIDKLQQSSQETLNLYKESVLNGTWEKSLKQKEHEIVINVSVTPETKDFMPDVEEIQNKLKKKKKKNNKPSKIGGSNKIQSSENCSSSVNESEKIESVTDSERSVADTETRNSNSRIEFCCEEKITNTDTEVKVNCPLESDSEQIGVPPLASVEDSKESIENKASSEPTQLVTTEKSLSNTSTEQKGFFSRLIKFLFG